jgi:hypothetical protein
MDLTVMRKFEFASFFSVGFYSFLVLNVFYVHFLLGLEGMGLIPERKSFSPLWNHFNSDSKVPYPYLPSALHMEQSVTRTEGLISFCSAT